MNETECLFDDGDHAPAELGHDLCPPCERRMIVVRTEETNR